MIHRPSSRQLSWWARFKRRISRHKKPATIVIGILGLWVVYEAVDEFWPKRLIAAVNDGSHTSPFSIPFSIRNVDRYDLDSAAIYCRIDHALLSNGVQFISEGIDQGKGVYVESAKDVSLKSGGGGGQLECKFDRVFTFDPPAIVMEATVTLIAKHRLGSVLWSTQYELGTFVWYPDLDPPRWLPDLAL